MMKVLLIILGVFGLTGCASVFGSGRGDEVFVVYNSRVPDSRGVAEHYASVRWIPASHVMGVDVTANEEMSRTEFREHLQKPLEEALEKRGLMRFEAVIIPATNGEPRRVERKVVESKIRYLVLCYGVPLKISPDSNLREPNANKLPAALQRNEAAVDNELACLPILDRMLLAGPRVNPLYGCTDAHLFNPTNDILMVTRLDGPTAEIARSLVDKAVQAETNGLWGRAYFDLRGLPKTDPMSLGDDWIRNASEICHQLGFDTVVDNNNGTFPASFPLSQVAFYAGWYDENVSGPFARPTVEFMPGAFAYHLHSFSAASLRTTRRQWVGPLLDRGVTATMGTVFEPYLGGTPNIGIFFARFLDSGFTFGEAAYACQNYLSWQTTVVGDPLYAPFAGSPAALAKSMEERHDKNLEWAILRIANVKRMQGTSVAEIVHVLENLDLARHSAVLVEKLAELYQAQGKPASSAQALQQVLKLDPTPQQRVRVMLNLGEHLTALGNDQAAYDNYRDFLKQFPDYPDPVSIYRPLLNLAVKLNHQADALKYQRQITELTEPHAPAGPQARRGT